MSKQGVFIIGALIIAGVIAVIALGGSTNPQETNTNNNTPTGNPEDMQGPTEQPPGNTPEDDQQQEDNAATITDTSSEEQASADESENTEVVTVRYTANGFESPSVTISKGDTVKFVNESGQGMWVASDVHPTHTNYAGTTLSEHCQNGADNNAFDQCDTGDTYSFAFEKTGEWGYHNHVNASHTGTITVTE